MKLTVGQLKSLIREAIAPPPAKRAAQLVSTTVDAATRYIDSLVAGNPDAQAVSELEELITQATSMAKWMSSHREPLSPSMMKFAQIALDVGKDVGFWSRPTFLGRREYVEKMKEKVKRLQRAQIDVLSN